MNTGLRIHSCVGNDPGEDVKVGVPAETKKVYTGNGIKALYSSHAGDVWSGDYINTGGGITIVNHDGAYKNCIATGDGRYAGVGNTPAVLAEAGDNAIIGVGLAACYVALDDMTAHLENM